MIRIINESGELFDTKILNGENGEDLSQALMIALGGTITIDRQITAKFELLMMRVDISARQTEWLTKHPISGDLEAIHALEFRDGTRIEFADDGIAKIVARAA